MNYWIFQSNPEYWPIKKELDLAFSDDLRTVYKQVSYWCFQERYRSKLKAMARNDVVFIWKSTGNEAEGSHGVYGSAVVLSLPEHGEMVYAPKAINAAWFEDLGWKLTLSGPFPVPGDAYVVILYKKKRLEEPILASELEKHGVLKDLRILRMPQARLFGPLTQEQGTALLYRIDH